MVELFLDGGPFMYPILLLLLGGLALVVERFRSLSQSQADSDGFMFISPPKWGVNDNGVVGYGRFT
jgi:hypothetical protein